MRSSGAHCDPELAKRIIDETLGKEDWIGEPLGEEDWREAWQRGLGRHLAKRIGEEEKEKEFL